MHPKIPTRQMPSILTLASLQFQGDYLLQHITPQLMGDFAMGIDDEMQLLVGKAYGIKVEMWTEIAQEHMRSTV